MFDLEAVGDDKSDRDSEKGIVQDYVWKLTGVRPGHEASQGNFTNWYGASLNMQIQLSRNDLKKSVPAPPKGTKFEFTLTPAGNLIDGKPGKALTFTREMELLWNGNLADIPLGEYTVKGEEVAPDGSRKGLLMEVEFAKYGESAPVKFEPGSSVGAWPRNQGFTRQ